MRERRSIGLPAKEWDMRILVVEDNRDILANLADYLSLKG